MEKLTMETKANLKEDIKDFLKSKGAYPEDLIQSLGNVVEIFLDKHTKTSDQTEDRLLNQTNLSTGSESARTRKPVHFPHEELFLRYYPMFGEHMEVNEEYNRSFKCVYKRAIYFLESNCSGIYGFKGEIHHPEKDYESCYGIPTSFDSALAVPFLFSEEIGRIAIDGLINAIKIHARPSGFWGYFAPIDDEDTGLFPYDIDDTSIPMLALFITGHKTLGECQDNVLKMVASALKDSTGALGTWLPNLDKAPSGEPRKFLYTKPFTEIKMDVSCLVNFLCYAAVVRLDKYEGIQPSVTFVAKFVDELVENRGKATLLAGMIYYPNRFPIYLFLSRYAHHSPNARSIFGEKLKMLVKEEILEFTNEWGKAMDIACCILAALYLNLHEDQEADQDLKNKLDQMFSTLLSLQLKDGSFEKGILFKMTHFGHYGGSRYVSTALAVSAIGRYNRQVVQNQVAAERVY